MAKVQSNDTKNGQQELTERKGAKVDQIVVECCGCAGRNTKVVEERPKECTEIRECLDCGKRFMWHNKALAAKTTEPAK